jgi:radical SAM protein with 4Fe4S-binding SPASM domain
LDENTGFKNQYKEENPLLIHLTVTGRCYARCEGCINRTVTQNCDDSRNREALYEDTNPERDSRLILFLARINPRQKVTVCFYGGEPFLALDKMVGVWKHLKRSPESDRFRFLVYTSGEFLIEALTSHPDFIKDIWLYSVSIDGDETQHDRVRQGTSLMRTKENLAELARNHSGPVLFWSTLREGQSLWNCFIEFLEMENRGHVNHMFWHWAESRKPIEKFSAFLDNYQRDLEQVMKIYIQYLKKNKLLSIIHINELVLYLLSGKERGHSACRVELAQNYDILSGRIYPCADLPSCLSIGGVDEKGEIFLQDEDLSYLVAYKKDIGCFSCPSHFYCGGRCPVQILAGSEERTKQYCQLMHLHIEIVRDKVVTIQKELEKSGLDLQDVFDRSAFLTAYTDVVP